LAILFITVFALSQYAKQLAYLQCKLANDLTNTTQKCDCEKQTGNAGTDKELPTTKNHTHSNIDEFYTTVKDITANTHALILLPVAFFGYNTGEQDGNSDRLERPPIYC
jgi:hypothetical protein